jgi:uncharacterized membrane protein YhaH (DUF805 family)
MPIITKKEFRHFFRDRAAVWLLICCAALTGASIINVVLKVRGSDLQVPTRYTQYSLTLDRGNWTILYELALFVLMAFVLNAVIAIKVRPLRRMYALAILGLTLFVLLIGFLVSNALVSLLSS